MNQENTSRTLWVAVDVVIGLLSIFMLTKLYDVVIDKGDYVRYLSSKGSQVMGLTGAATASSIALTFIPGDVGSPVADKLADISSYTTIIMCAIYLEKYLLALAGKIAFRFIVPAACAFCAINHYAENIKLRSIITKLFAIAVIIVTVLPISVSMSKAVEGVYEDNKSIQSTIDTAQQVADDVQNNSGSKFTAFIASVKDGVNGLVKKFERTLSNFVESIAVFIVTTCLIPILTMALLIWMVKVLFGINTPTPTLETMAGKTRVDRHKVVAKLSGKNELIETDGGDHE